VRGHLCSCCAAMRTSHRTVGGKRSQAGGNSASKICRIATCEGICRLLCGCSVCTGEPIYEEMQMWDVAERLIWGLRWRWWSGGGFERRLQRILPSFHCTLCRKACLTGRSQFPCSCENGCHPFQVWPSCYSLHCMVGVGFSFYITKGICIQALWHCMIWCKIWLWFIVELWDVIFSGRQIPLVEGAGGIILYNCLVLDFAF
jgi:hypothetical protein